MRDEQPWAFEIPQGVDHYQVLRDARDATSKLHRLLMLQVALTAETSSIDRPSSGAIADRERVRMDTMLAIGRRQIDAAMRRVGTIGSGPATLAVLQASLLPITIEITDWTLIRVRDNGKRHLLGQDHRI